jgi:CBS domain containing-hemolysin-like protein
LIQFITLIILIALSSFFSASETAFSSVNLIRLKTYEDQKRMGARQAVYIAGHFNKAISTILIGNNVVNIAAASIATLFFTKILPDTGALVSTAVMTILVLIFGEVLPKTYAKHHPEKFALNVAIPLYALMNVLTPFSYFLVRMNESMISLYGHNEQPSVTEDELITIIDQIEEEGVLEEEEGDLIRSAIEFDDTTVEDILTPRTDMVGIELKMKTDEIVPIMLEHKFSRIPVYDDSIDKIVGILYERDLFGKIVQQEQPISIKRLMKEPIFVSKTMKINSLLELLQKSKAHMAIVLDAYGGTAGIVTLEDVIEELVGDIYDEHDDVPENVKRINETTFEVDDEVDLEDFIDDYLPELEIEESNYPTVGGWAYELFEKIPETGDEVVVVDGKIKLTALKVENYRIQKVKIELLTKDDE